MSALEPVKLYSSDGFRLCSSDGSYLYATPEKVLENVEMISQIPNDAKKAVQDFIREHFENLCEKFSDIDLLEPGVELLNQFPEFIQYIKLAFEGFM